MKKNIIYLILIVLLLEGQLTISKTFIPSLHLKDNNDNIPQLPVYVGTGYDVLYGNPLHTQKVDPGFTTKIFNFTYNNKQVTQDGRYLIPDRVNHVKVSSCSYSSEVSTHRGTQSYQSKLDTKALINGGYEGKLIKASFSKSSTYQKIQNSTLITKDTITQTMAECQNYKLSIDLFQTIPIMPNFKAGVQQSYKSKNWDTFIEQYGSHFVYETIMGGRAIQQIQYSIQSMQKLQSIDVDINIAAKATFAKFYGDTSFDWHKYQNQIAYTQTQKSLIQQIYIGGIPPKNGNVKDWEQKVIEDPMPITYKMLPLSELFTKINSAQILNITDAQNSFLQHLDLYCEKKGCRVPTPDLPKPNPATIQQNDTQAFGASSGMSFSWKVPTTTLNLKTFLIRCGKYIDQIQIELSDGVKTYFSPIFGGTGGGAQNYTLPQSHTLHEVGYRSGSSVDSLTFYTDKGAKSPQYGENGGSPHMLTIPQGYRVVGIFGYSGQYLNKLGFHLAKTVYKNGEQEVIEKQLVLIK